MSIFDGLDWLEAEEVHFRVAESRAGSEYDQGQEKGLSAPSNGTKLKRLNRRVISKAVAAASTTQAIANDCAKSANASVSRRGSRRLTIRAKPVPEQVKDPEGSPALR